MLRRTASRRSEGVELVGTLSQRAPSEAQTPRTGSKRQQQQPQRTSNGRSERWAKFKGVLLVRAGVAGRGA